MVKLCAANQYRHRAAGRQHQLVRGQRAAVSRAAQIVLNLSRMNRIRAIDPTNYTMTVEAGCKLADVREAAEKNNRFFPLGLTATQKYCEIGGNLSTNAGGINVLRYGNARDLVLGLEVVLPDGRIWNGLRSLRKDNSGYDLKHLFIGAEGTLGIITAAVLKLYPRPQAEATACVAVRDPAAAVALLSHLRAACGDKISAFEIISRSCLDLVFKHIPDTREPFASKHEWIVITQLADVLSAPLDAALREALRIIRRRHHRIRHHHRQGSCRALVETAQEHQRSAEARGHQHQARCVGAGQPHRGIHRARRCRVAQRFPGIRIVAFGHMGDGNIHYNVSMPDAAAEQDFHRAAGSGGEQTGVCGGARTQRQHQRRARPGTAQAR